MPRAPSCAPALCLWRAARSQKRLLFARRSPRGRTRRTRAHACRSSNSSSRASASTARRRSVAKPRLRPRSSTRVAMAGLTAQARPLCICRRSVTIGSFGPRRRRAGARAPIRQRAREAGASELLRALRRSNIIKGLRSKEASRRNLTNNKYCRSIISQQTPAQHCPLTSSFKPR